MRTTQFMIVGSLFLAMLSGCNSSGDKKTGSDDNQEASASINSDEDVTEIIAFNNQMVSVDNTHKNFIRNFMDKVDAMDEFIKKKLTNPSAVAIAPIMTMPVILSNADKNIKAPSSLKGDYAVWLDSLKQGFEEIQNVKKDLDAYKSAEDWKEDQGKKMDEFRKRTLAAANKNRNASNAIFKALGPAADEAEKEILKDHPLKDQIISSREIMDLTERITANTFDATDIAKYKPDFEASYKKLDELYQANIKKTIDEKNSSKKSSFDNFNDAVNKYLGKMRILQREFDGNQAFSEQALVDLDNAAKAVLTWYNNFVN